MACTGRCPGKEADCSAARIVPRGPVPEGAGDTRTPIPSSLAGSWVWLRVPAHLAHQVSEWGPCRPGEVGGLGAGPSAGGWGLLPWAPC